MLWPNKGGQAQCAQGVSAIASSKLNSLPEAGLGSKNRVHRHTLLSKGGFARQGRIVYTDKCLEIRLPRNTIDAIHVDH